MATQTVTDQIVRLASIQPLVRSRDVEIRGIPREYLLRLYRQGLLRRAARGVYALAEAPVSEHHSLAVVTKIVPHAVVCLLSALRFHGLTTQDPHEIWIAIDNKARRPSLFVFPEKRSPRGSLRTPLKVFLSASTVLRKQLPTVSSTVTRSASMSLSKPLRTL
jgi:hypothetical protein